MDREKSLLLKDKVWMKEMKGGVVQKIKHDKTYLLICVSEPGTGGLVDAEACGVGYLLSVKHREVKMLQVFLKIVR